MKKILKTFILLLSLNRLNKWKFKHISLFSILFISNNILCQNLTIKDLTSLCSKSNWEEVNQILFSKNWVFFNSKNDDDNTNRITWSNNINYDSERAQAWINLYCSGNQPEKIEYTFFNKNYYIDILKSISKTDFKISNNGVYNNSVQSKYENSAYVLYISTSKRENNEIFNSSPIVYSLTILKKKKIEIIAENWEYEFYDNGEIKAEYIIENGKLNGECHLFYENGELKQIGYFKNNLENGVFYFYNDEGKITSEYNMLNGEKNGYYIEYDYYGDITTKGHYKKNLKHGVFKQFYDNGEIETENYYENDLLNGIEKSYHYNKNIKTICNYKNGELEGVFKEFNDDGKLISEVTFLNGIKNGVNTEFKYNDSKLLHSKISGFYKNDKKEGLWEDYEYDETNNPILISITNYSNNQKNGLFKLIKKDTLFVGNYFNDLLNGEYKIYVDLENKVKNIHDSKDVNLLVHGNFNNNLKNGEWNYYYPLFRDEKNNVCDFSNKLFLTEKYFEGQLNGFTTRYSILKDYKIPCDKIDTCLFYKCVKLIEIQNYSQGKLNGLYELKDSLSEIIISGNYIDNLKNGVWIIKNDVGYNKKIIESGNYKNDLKEGLWLSYFNENQILESYNYSNGKLNGVSKKYNYFNNSVVEEFYKNDILNKIEKKSIHNDELYAKYELFYSDISGFNCKKSNYFKNDSCVITNYWLKNNFPINLSTLEFSINMIDSIELIENGYKNGEFYTLSKNKPSIIGNYDKNLKQGVWKYFYFEQKVVIELNYNLNNIVSELYYELNSDFFYVTNDLFYGTFEFVDKEKNIGEYRKIKNGLRHGVSKTYDLNTMKVLFKEKYIDGIKK